MRETLDDFRKCLLLEAVTYKTLKQESFVRRDWS